MLIALDYYRGMMLVGEQHGEILGYVPLVLWELYRQGWEREETIRRWARLPVPVLNEVESKDSEGS